MLTLTHLLIPLIICTPLAHNSDTPQPNVQTIFEREFPTQVADIIVRSNHPEQLIVTYSAPAEIRILNLTHNEPLTVNNTHLCNFTQQSVLGITELHPDIYAVVVGNTILFPNYQPIQGTYSIYQLDMTSYDVTGTPNITKLVALNNSKNADGIATLATNPPILLVADSTAGEILKVDPATGAIATFSSHDTMKPLTGARLPIGINGLRYYDNYIYFTNTYAHGLYRIPLNLRTINGSRPTVNFTTLRPDSAPQLMIQDGNFPRADGFAVRRRGNRTGSGSMAPGADDRDLEVIVLGGNSVVRVSAVPGSGWGYTTIAGAAESLGMEAVETVVAGSTTGAFGLGRWNESVFVGTGGGLAAGIGGFTGGSVVVRIGV